MNHMFRFSQLMHHAKFWVTHDSFPCILSTSIKSSSLYKKKAARPAATAPKETYCTAALDLKLEGDALGPVVVVLELGMEELLPVSWKLAHVRRVALALWITTDRLPKKLAGPEAVER